MSVRTWIMGAALVGAAGCGTSSSSPITITVTAAAERGAIDGKRPVKSTDRFVVVTVSITNGHSGPIPLTFASFGLETAAGIELPASTFTAFLKKACPATALLQVEKTFACDVAFEIGEGARGVRVWFRAGEVGEASADVTPKACTKCGTACVDTSVDPNHCGSCGFRVGTGAKCAKGKVVCANPARDTACGGQCVDLQTSTGHCGRCNNALSPGVGCTFGKATCSDRTYTLCSNACRDVTRDTSNCGKCGRACTSSKARCDKGQRCLVREAFNYGDGSLKWDKSCDVLCKEKGHKTCHSATIPVSGRSLPLSCSLKPPRIYQGTSVYGLECQCVGLFTSP